MCVDGFTSFLIDLPFFHIFPMFMFVFITFFKKHILFYFLDDQSVVQKLGFFHGSIVTNDEPMLLAIDGKWFEIIVHMIESEFLICLV
jgi:hypothetical protein